MSSSPVNTFPLSEHKIAVILLAAGRGTRMGGPVPKLLLPMPDGRPLLLHSLENALSLFPLDVIVVLRPELSLFVQRARFKVQRPRSPLNLRGAPITYVPNPRYTEGMGTSLAVGISTLLGLSPQVEACLVMLGDQPSVTAPIVERLVEAYLRERAAITIPIYGDQPGPPTLFSRIVFPQLAHLKGDVGGRQLLTLYPDKVARVPFDEHERPRDIDTPEDYRSIE